MRRYLIILLASLGAILVFYAMSIFLKKVLKKNSFYFPFLSGLITFILILIISFFYLEESSSDINFKYNPPKYSDGKIIDGEFNSK